MSITALWFYILYTDLKWYHCGRKSENDDFFPTHLFIQRATFGQLQFMRYAPFTAISCDELVFFINSFLFLSLCWLSFQNEPKAISNCHEIWSLTYCLTIWRSFTFHNSSYCSEQTEYENKNKCQSPPKSMYYKKFIK